MIRSIGFNEYSRVTLLTAATRKGHQRLKATHNQLRFTDTDAEAHAVPNTDILIPFCQNAHFTLKTGEWRIVSYEEGIVHTISTHGMRLYLINTYSESKWESALLAKDVFTYKELGSEFFLSSHCKQNRQTDSTDNSNMTITTCIAYSYVQWCNYAEC